MRTMLLGDMKQMEAFLPWLQRSKEIFEIEMIISENDMASYVFVCDILPVHQLERISLEYDIFFICSMSDEPYIRLLSMLGVDRKRIKSSYQICEYLTPADCMEFHNDNIKNYINHGIYTDESINIGDFTYGIQNLNIRHGGEGKTLTIGKFCSIASNITIFLGDNHRDDWCSTYPFNILMNEFSYIKGHPKSNGDVVIGNDVWIGSDAKILSGVTIGDGCVIGANALVTKDVSPYTIVGGVPAKKIRDRFSPDIIERLLEIKWWEWDNALIYEAIPLLQSSFFDELFAFYEKNVSGCQPHL